jgi:hypothetical protein
MDQRSKWIVFALVVSGVVVVGCLILALLGTALGWGAFGSSVPQMRGDRMGGMCPWCRGTGYQTPWVSVGGVVMVLLVVALPLGLITLLIAGGVWLARSVKSTPSPNDESLACPTCGKEVKPGWKACPNCGERLVE